jgi:anthranilate synthase component 1
MNVSLKCNTKKVFADQITPIGIYLNVRNLFPASILLESSEVDDKSNSSSIICADPIGGISLTQDRLKIYYGNKTEEKPAASIENIRDEMRKFFNSFNLVNRYEGINGFFGFQSFEAVRYFETKRADLCRENDEQVALLDYRIYRYVISINHFNGEVIFIENLPPESTSKLEEFVSKILTQRSGTFPFSIVSQEASNCTDEEFKTNVEKARNHCQRGDTFQIVLSRRFSRNYRGDEFNVYRALRHINPSPYMFFFDYGSYKIFGSSPEAQLRITDNEAVINPIAGTYKRSGDKKEDELLSEELLKDKKELAEHNMLVDLARNDLSRHCGDVYLEDYKKIHHYSHVIHMVSTVKGKLPDSSKNIEVLADTFPAGTLSGAPKVKAIQILTRLEKDPRGYYGGSIGFIDFKGNINQAIIIRSFMTSKNKINYRAGAGIVLNSDPESELKEVDNKLGALRKAIIEAEQLSGY